MPVFARSRCCHTGSQRGCAHGCSHQLGDRKKDTETIRTGGGVRAPIELEA